jgi:hypothetical protein
MQTGNSTCGVFAFPAFVQQFIRKHDRQQRSPARASGLGAYQGVLPAITVALGALVCTVLMPFSAASLDLSPCRWVQQEKDPPTPRERLEEAIPCPRSRAATGVDRAQRLWSSSVPR